MTRATGLEAAWAATRGPVCSEIGQIVDPVFAVVRRERVFRIGDSASALTATVDEDWVRRNFAPAVRGSLSGVRIRPEPRLVEPEPGWVEEPDWALEIEAARRLFLASFPNPRRSLDDFAAVFLHPWIGRDVRRHGLPDDLRPKAATARAKGVPLQLVLPAFPFKDQNPLRTGAPASHVDLSEILMLIRLHLLDVALRCFGFGADWIVITEGRELAPIFGVDPRDASAYGAALRTWKNALGLEGSIHVLDFGDVVGELPEFDAVRSEILRLLPRVVGGTKGFEVLVRGTKTNLNLLDEHARLGDDRLCRVLDESVPDAALDAEERSARGDVLERAREAALQYAAINLAAKASRVYERLFPEAVRATAHPKPGQIGVSYGVGSEQYPWNGVPIVTGGQTPLLASTVVKPAWRARRLPGVRSLYLPSNPSAPLFYLRAA